MGPILNDQPLSAETPWKVADPDVSHFGKQLREVAKLIKISKDEHYFEVTNAAQNMTVRPAFLIQTFFVAFGLHD